MFKRKTRDEDGSEMSHEEAKLFGDTAPSATPPRPRPPEGPSAPAESAGKPLAVPARPIGRPTPDFARRVGDMQNPARKGEQTPMPETKAAETKKLIVGRDISLNGKISSCDRLVVEGEVEAELHDCHTIEIAESGTFKGAAEIEGAEVSGRYEGSLTVRGNLLIRGSGRVSGTVRYGRLQIEDGGEINGDIKSLNSKAEKGGEKPRQAESPAAGGNRSPSTPSVAAK